MIKQQLDLVDNTINSAYDGAELYHDLSDKDIVIEKGNVKYESVCLKHWRVENEEYTINR